MYFNEKQEPLLTKEEVRRLVINYRENQHTHINNNINFIDELGDASSSWYSLSALKQFIDYLVEYHLENPDERPIEGVRVYYGAYPEDFEAEPSYAKRHCVIFVATSKDPANPALQRNRISETKKLNDQETLLAYIGNNPEKHEDPNARNAGRLCPPKCNGGQIV